MRYGEAKSGTGATRMQHTKKAVHYRNWVEDAQFPIFNSEAIKEPNGEVNKYINVPMPISQSPQRNTGEIIIRPLSHTADHFEKPPIFQLLMNSPAFYGTRRFSSVFTRVLHWPLSCARSIQSIPSHSIPLSSILILSTYLRPGLPSGPFPSGFPTNILYASSFHHSCYMPFPSDPPWLHHSNYTWRTLQVLKLIMQFSPASCHFMSLRPKYSP
jgi:hypothetical protein